ncbi:hypothetical protein DFH09DRAFT_941007 [Mycena vulgaris]|nr:hypothetical protein DFH09DRAFT_941021 [Mycena vulgaris]KAJ6514642.1 hypothetical protein DFH09DRAFT_941007 [Mycena vulgaris]
MTDLRMEFKPPTLLPGEHAQITGFCRAIRTNNWGLLGSSTTAIVYSHNGQWWHANEYDTRPHVTVRYDRRLPATRRVHIYRDGTANLNPQNGLRLNRAGLKTTTALAESAFDEEGSDGSVEFSDEEDEESPETAGN